MKAYKITGKLGDICSFVGGNEVKKGDMVYFHSESDMKQECVAKPQGNEHMSIEAMKQALEALEVAKSCIDGYYLPKGKAWLPEIEEAITSLRQTIAEIETHEPVAQVDANDDGYWADILPDRSVKVGQLLYTTPLNPMDSIKSSKTLDAQPQREWVGLTDEEREEIALEVPMDAVLITEAKLKEKNGYAEEKNT